jgi:hypothetical protein
VVDLNRREVRWRGEVVRLTKLDFELMSCLAQRPIRAWSFEGFSMKHGMIHTDMIETSYTQPYAGFASTSPTHASTDYRRVGVRLGLHSEGGALGVFWESYWAATLSTAGPWSAAGRGLREDVGLIIR